MLKESVLIVDDDEAIRDSLKGLFQARGFHAEAFASAQDFLAYKPGDNRACAILDIQMPGMSGLDLQAELNKAGSNLPVIMLTSHANVPKAVTALKAGAVDFIEKPFDIAALLSAVRTALDRCKMETMSTPSSVELNARLASLTPREREILDLVVAGHPNKVIASRLDISVRTAEAHRSKVMEKMECRNLPSLIHLMLRHT